MFKLIATYTINIIFLYLQKGPNKAVLSTWRHNQLPVKEQGWNENTRLFISNVFFTQLKCNLVFS